jgi:hypothetical protein
MTKNLKKIKAEKKLQFTYPWASIKGTQATGEAFSPQKRTSSNSKHEFLYFFSFLWVIFALLDPDPHSATQINADPCGSGSATLNTNVTFCHLLCAEGSDWRTRSTSSQRMMRVRTETLFLSPGTGKRSSVGRGGPSI